jgi:large repetitive protein
MCKKVVTLCLVAAFAAACDSGNTQPPLPDGGTDLAMSDGPPPNPDMTGGSDGGPKITMCPAANQPPLASGTCETVAGSAAKLITATVLTPGEVLRGGQVYVDTAGIIQCVGCDCTAMAAGATTINCPTGVLSPGIVNAHDHITFQSAPGTDSGERYEQRHDWRIPKRGHTRIPSGPTATGAQVQWAELRGVMAGETSTVGSGGQLGILRNLDRADPLEQGLAQKPVHFDTFPLGDQSGTQLTSGCAYPAIQPATGIAADDAYFPHVSEGIDSVARNEFLCESSSMNGGQDLTQPQSAFIHSIGLLAPDYALMAAESVSIVWSPRSNVRLYGDTAVVTQAWRDGVLVALGTDWLPSGSMNSLRELKCADSLNKTYYDHFFTDEQIWLMATQNAAMASAMDDVIGIIRTGLHADLSIFNGATHIDHRALIDADPNDVVLVLRDGKALYGDQSVVSLLPDVTPCDTLNVCGVDKSICIQQDLGLNLMTLTTNAGAGVYPLFFCPTALMPNPDHEPSCTPARPMGVNGSTVYDGAIGPGDMDGDAIPDTMDNCPRVFNPIRPVDNGAQADFDGDGVGDACDPCPLIANMTTCPTVDPNDVDGDGVPNAIDNCPNAPNTNQLDTDTDGKGDACDSCPMQSNPGTMGCPATIYQIKTMTMPATLGAVVSLANALVTARAANGFFVQVKETDAGYTGPDNSGLFVFTATAPTVNPGDRVTVTNGTVTNFNGQIELSMVSFTVGTTGGAPPVPVTESAPGVPLTVTDLASGTKAAALEGVIVRLANVSVTDIAPPPGTGDTTPTNEFVVGGALRVNDLLYLTTPFPVVGDSFTSLTGILEFRNANFKLEPRAATDEVFGPPQLVSFGPPSGGFVRVGQIGVPTIPAPGIVLTLSRMTTINVDVTLTSTDPTSLGVQATVTIPAGSISSAPVLFDGNVRTTGFVDVNATTTSSGSAIGHVRVIDVAEAPTLTDLSPATVTVDPTRTATLTVTLDLPAPAGGAAVTVAAVSGTVSTPVTVPADTLSTTFTYTAPAAPGTDTVTATLGASKMATINIKPPHLVINEVDYDQPSTDTLEFIELYNPAPTAADLTGLAVVFVNGSNNNEYSRVALSGSLAAGGYLVIASAAVNVDPGATKMTFGAATNNIQNGNPDGVAIIDTVNGTVIDALSYGGSITAANITGLTGARSLVEGTAATARDSATATGALIRNPNGTDTDNALADWKFTTTPTPGAANVP